MAPRMRSLARAEARARPEQTEACSTRPPEPQEHSWGMLTPFPTGCFRMDLGAIVGEPGAAPCSPPRPGRLPLRSVWGLEPAVLCAGLTDSWWGPPLPGAGSLGLGGLGGAGGGRSQVRRWARPASAVTDKMPPAPTSAGTRQPHVQDRARWAGKLTGQGATQDHALGETWRVRLCAHCPASAATSEPVPPRQREAPRARALADVQGKNHAILTSTLRKTEPKATAKQRSRVSRLRLLSAAREGQETRTPAPRARLGTPRPSTDSHTLPQSSLTRNKQPCRLQTRPKRTQGLGSLRPSSPSTPK